MLHQSLFHTFLLSLLLIGTVMSCATNPATGERQLALMSPEQEIAMGQQAHAEILKAMEALDNPGLQRYVNDIGQRLAASSERPELPWTFTVLDDPVVNAFALPGGYIYITRGLLTYLTSEAELAGVLGHEIGHVTARHSVEQMSQTTLGSLGLGIGILLYPELQELGRAAQQGMQLLFLKFSRDDEREADRLGLRYMTDLQYAPQKLTDVMDVLAAVSQAQDQEKMPGWLATHPAPEERRELIVQTIRSENLQPQNPIVNQNEYLQHIDGLIFGSDPRDGYFVESRFYHPDLQWRMEFPEGWQTTNQRDVVGALSPSRDAAMVLGLTRSRTVDEAALQFRQQKGLSFGPLQAIQVSGASGVLLPFRAQTDPGIMDGLAAFLSYQGKVYQVMGYSMAARWAAYRPQVLQTFESFQPITDKDILSIQPLRITVTKLPQSMSLSAFVERRSSPVPVSRLAMINQVEPQETLAKGTPIKRVDGQLPPGARNEIIF
ncbi:M48 family metalloprotease [Oligoflexus tunisiensis]|uniref:M48 family metalloprotease n=1 Tax=Oligoflexus tunisiensis TaxID=708132 RepID=UPI000A86191B|nr:M48 family metallopeptidase [Oligoflexus tunisiensis]